MAVILFLDTILVPSSIFITIAYHAYLWHNFRHKPTVTTIGINMMKRRSWLQLLNQGDDKKGMLAVQSLRNTLMATILTASITILITVALGVLTNNALKANHLFKGTAVLGSQSGKMMALKFGFASIFLLASFLCSSMAVANLIDANFLINALGEYSSSSSSSPSLSSPEHTRTVLERGFTLAVVGNRVLCISFPLLVWMFGPLPMALSSVALVWGLHGLDFQRNFVAQIK